jgi:putative endonuclease
LTNQITGKWGEDLAADLLLKKGFTIVARNYRCGYGEIDLIARTPSNLLVFVEVKTRKTTDFGGPEGAVDLKKQQTMARTAARYMASIAYDWEIRFDIITVVYFSNGRYDIHHIEDAFF